MRIISRADGLIAQETRSRKLIALVDNITSDSITSLVETVGVLLLKDESAKQRRAESEARLRAAIKALDKMTRADPKQHELVHNFKAAVRSMMIREIFLVSVPNDISTSKVSSKNPMNAARYPELFEQYALLGPLQELEEKKVERLVEAISKQAGHFVLTLLTGSLLSIGSLVILAMLIWRDVSSRIEHVQVNALHLLSQTSPEKPPLSKDEIFELDNAIYRAAIEIDANEQLRRNYVSVVTHELRSPLASLQGTLELMSSGAFGQIPSTVQSTLELALLTLRPVLELINDFLGLESAKSGKLQIVRQSQYIADVFELCAVEIPETFHSRVVFEEESGESIFNLDIHQISRVISNLIKLVLQQAEPETVVMIRGYATEDNAGLAIDIRYQGGSLSEVLALSSSGLDGEWPVDSASVPAFLRLLLCSIVLRLHGGSLQFCSESSDQHKLRLELSTEEMSAQVNGTVLQSISEPGEVNPKASRQLRKKVRALFLSPLVFMLVLPAIIAVMLVEVKQDQEREHRAWTIYSDIAAVKNQSATSSIAAVLYNFTADDWSFQRWRSDAIKARASLDHLSSLLASPTRNPDSDFDQYRQSVLKMSEIYERVLKLPKNTIVENFWKAPIMMELHAEHSVNERLTANLLYVSGMQREFLSKKSLMTRSVLLNILFSSIVAGVILCVSLVLFVSAFITTRLAALVKTTRALSARNALPAKLDNSDEFSRIDAVLHEADRRLREFESFKNRAAAVMMHQLSTPLDHLRSQIENIDAQYGGIISDRARHRLKRSAADCGRLQRLLEDLRSVQGMVGGKFELTRTAVTTDEIIETAVASIDSAAIKAGVAISRPNRSALVNVDPDRIVQVMINLLSNAIKFSDRDSIVEIEVESGGADAIVSVIDHGRGMSTEFQQKLFTAFEQMEISDSSRKNGTGLGLYLCKTLVEQHGGSISVESMLNEGTTFRIKLPLS